MGNEKKTAVITGGTSGIGLAAAALFLENGWRVLLIGRSKERGAAALQALSGGADCAFESVDIAEAAQRRQAAAAALRFGRVDALINCAGVYLERALADMTESVYDELMRVNVKGTYFACKEFLPYLKQSPSGAIVNVSSDAGINGNYFCSAYCASKGAVTVLTKALALELAPIRVNCVCPGDIDTPLTRAQLAEEPARREEELRAMRALYPLGRIGTAREAAEVIFFLASEKATFVTGAAWTVDGGITAC